MLFSKEARTRRGFSVIEVLISLAILSLVLAASVRFIGAPSATLEQREQLTELFREAADYRLRAVSSSEDVLWRVANLDCDTPNQDVDIVFFPDGSATGKDLCLRTKRLRLHRALGILEVIE